MTLAAAVVLFQLVCPLVIASQQPRDATSSFASTSDAARYRTISEAKGTPYRDFEVEYPPVALGLFRAVGPSSFDGFRLRLLALQAACQALIVVLLFRVWGNRAAWSYLVLSAPMLFVVYSGFDLVGVALAVVGAALVRRDRPVSGGIAFVVGAFTKIWPVVLIPSLLARRQARAFAVSVAAGLAGLVAWSVWGGRRAIGQVLTYRSAPGWEYESLPGSLVRLFTRGALHFEAGAWRVGAPPRVAGWIVSVALVVAVAAIWWMAARRPTLPDGVAETAAIAALLVFATLLSPQFLIWLLPFAAITAAQGASRIERWAGATAVLTLVVRIFFDPVHPALLRSEIAVISRNLALVGLLVVAGTELWRAPARMGEWSPARSPEASPTLRAPISSSTPKGA